ncbi:MAG TPA: carboxypeptidase-like regulatory domain-containing protein [Terriglobia bacterium]|nr:carboxypeptidase-like regulatory domain-containing protein [Terriglobia bacterium]
MQRFNIGDRIVLLSRFAHLYPSGAGEIVGVQIDPRRAILNEYTVQFPDGSIASLFEFQIQRDVSQYQTAQALVAFDSTRQTPFVPVRGSAPDRHLLLQTPAVDIDMKIYWIKSRASIIGQILERTTANVVVDAEVTLTNRSLPTGAAITDSQGTFMFTGLNPGPLDIDILIHPKALKISGSLTI